MAILKTFLSLFLLSVILAPSVRAQGVKPVSVSYENILRCFPELQDEQISFKVDLNRLKEVIDTKFVTTQSQLRQRKVHYLDPDKKAMNLILRTRGTGKLETELILQQVDEKGIITDVKLTPAQSRNPKQDIINNFLLGATIKSDEYIYNDTKLNGTVATYTRNFKDVHDISFRDVLGTRAINCEKRSDLGIICTCTRK